MTVSIRLNQTVFDPGGIFFGVQRNRSVLCVGSGKPEAYIGKIAQTYDAGHLSWRGSQFTLNIDWVGTNINDINFELLVKDNPRVQADFLGQIIDFMFRGYIIVERDGTALTPTQVKNFVA